MQKKIIVRIVFYFIVWRIALFIVGASADFILPYAPSFPYADGILNSFNLPRWLYSWGNFDGVHYLTIAARGYQSAEFIQAFFPLYPLLIQIGTVVFQNALLSSLVISNVLFLLLLYVWYLFIKSEYSKKIAQFSLLALLLFPTSFFFVASYTESLFLLCVLGAFWATRKQKYWLAALCVAFASATRIVGILLLPALLFEIVFPQLQWSMPIKSLYTYIRKELKQWKKFLLPILIISCGSIGFVGYSYYLYITFGDPLYFFHVQSEFGGGVRQESLVFYPQVIWRYFKILLTARPFDLKYFSYVQEIVAGVLGFLVILWSFKKIQLSYSLFSLFAFLLPTLTGTFSSMPRYILVCFPLFIVIALKAEKSKTFLYFWFLFSTFLLVLNTVLFIQGYWVA